MTKGEVKEEAVFFSVLLWRIKEEEETKDMELKFMIPFKPNTKKKMNISLLFLFSSITRQKNSKRI